MKHILLLLILCSFGSNIQAQKTFQPKQLEVEWKGVVYRSEWNVDLKIHTNGAALAFNTGKILTYYKTKYYHFEIGYLKDPREKSQNLNLILQNHEPSRSFKYGKQNSMINLRAGMGMKRYLTEKAKRKGIAIGYDYQVGPSLALLKPYYLDLIYASEIQGQISFEILSEKYSEENAEKFLDIEKSIYGSSGFSKGLDEISIVPGIQGKLGLFFSMGAFDKYVKAIELGVKFDAFIKKIPIMVETSSVSNKPYFINFYLTLQLGKRSN